MPKYGNGLNREIMEAVRQGELPNKLNYDRILGFARGKGWDVTDSYLRVALTNGSAENHSRNYKKYFEKTGEGEYRVRKEYL